MREKCNTLIMILIHTIYGRRKCNTCMTIYGCTPYFVVNLWMVGFRQVPHSNQDTQASIESYHGALKHWFSLETKGLQSWWIDWLVWKLTTTIAKHYMHTTEMKKRRFIKNKVVERIVKMSVEKATLIPHTNVTHGIDNLNKIGHAWMVQSQQHSNMTYKVSLPFTKYVYCTCEWVLHGNLCKHQVAIFLTCTDFIKENIFNIVRHGMDLIMEVLLPCLRTPLICTFMTMNLMMKNQMKITLKNHGLLICANLWDWMILPPMWKKRKNTTNLQIIHPHKKALIRMGDIM